MNQELKDLIKQLETRVRQLILQQGQLQEEQDKLRKQLGEKDDEILKLQAQNEELKQQYSRLKMAKYIDMAAAIVGSREDLYIRPICSALTCPQSPLQLHKITTDIIMEFGKVGLPVNILSMAMSGATTPVTIAGTLVCHNAEVLAGIVLSQLANKGAPVIYGSSTTAFDLQMASAPVGSPELGICNAGVIALAQYYNLPSYCAGT